MIDLQRGIHLQRTRARIREYHRARHAIAPAQVERVARYAHPCREQDAGVRQRARRDSKRRAVTGAIEGEPPIQFDRAVVGKAAGHRQR